MKGMDYFVTLSRGYDPRLAVPIIATGHAKVVNAVLRELRTMALEGLVDQGEEEPRRRRRAAPSHSPSERPAAASGGALGRTGRW